MSQQQRMILAIALSFLFFIGYGYFLPKPQMATDQNITSTVASQNAPASNVQAPATRSNQAPIQNSTQSVAAPQTTATSTANIIASIKAKDYQLEIDSLGRIIKYEVLKDRFRDEDGSYPSLISDISTLKPLEIRFKDASLNGEAFTQSYTADNANITLKGTSKTLILTQKLSSTTVTKTIKFNEDGTYNINVTLSNPSDFFISPGFRPDQAADMYTFKGTLIEKADGTTDTIEDGDGEGNEVFMGASVIASSDKYYTTTFYDYDNRMNIYMSKDHDDNPLPFIKGTQNLSFNGYIGAKEYDKLHSIDPRLTKVIEYGFFTFLAKPVFLFLKYLHSIIGNWGWSIVAITLIIRLVLYPLTYKGMVSMNRLKELSPKIKELQKQYKGEPQKMNAKMMELYKKNNANPMGGCLPMIMQIPVFFAIYRVLLNSIELKHADWILWYQDLSVMDPYYVLPVLMAGSMFWQQSITPTNFTDPMQEKIMKFLPLIFMFFFITFPAGLTLYWFVNNLFSVAQQYYVNSIFAKEKARKVSTS